MTNQVGNGKRWFNLSHAVETAVGCIQDETKVHKEVAALQVELDKARWRLEECRAQMAKQAKLGPGGGSVNKPPPGLQD